MNYTSKNDLGLNKQEKFDHINRMITLSEITLSGFHCIKHLYQQVKQYLH
jgi:hypothetical protein